MALSTATIKPQLPLEARNKIVNKLDELKLTLEEFLEIEDYYLNDFANRTNKPHLLARKTIRPLSGKLFPRSILSIPFGRRKGTYLLLKCHGKLNPLGMGVANVVTKAICLETGEMAAFRSGIKSQVVDNELVAIRALDDYPEYFAAGREVEYSGNCRERKWKQHNHNKLDYAKEVRDKIGVIMNFFSWNLEQKIPSLNYGEKLMVSLKIAKCVSFLHSLNWIHCDLKPANILIDEEGNPKLTDFGLTSAVNEEIAYAGTRGYEAPEAIDDRNRLGFFKAKTTLDIWSLGSLFVDIFYGSRWRIYQSTIGYEQLPNIPLEKYCQTLKNLFPDFENYMHQDSVIFQSLVGPDFRPTAQDIVGIFTKIINGGKTQNSN